MPRRKAEPSEVTIEYSIPLYVVRRDEELYGDSNLHVARVVVDDEAELSDGKGFTSDGTPLKCDDPDVTAAMELIETDRSVEWPAWESGW